MAAKTPIEIPEHTLLVKEFVGYMSLLALRKQALVIPVWFLVVLWFYFQNPRAGGALVLGSLIGAVLGMVTLHVFTRAFYLVRARAPESEPLFRPRRLILRPDVLEVLSPDLPSLKLSLKKVQRASLESGFLMLHTGPSQQFLIPLRAFASGEDQERALELLRKAELLEAKK